MIVTGLGFHQLCIVFKYVRGARKATLHSQYDILVSKDRQNM